MQDSEAPVEGFAELFKNTVEAVKKECLVPGKPLVMGDLTCVCLAYSQYGIIANLLGLNKIEEAEPYLNAALDYWNTTSMTYILPEMIFIGNRDWWGEFDTVEEPKRLREFFPWLFKGGQPTEGVFGLIRDSGNLCPTSHFLYLVDLIVGIAHVDDYVQILPRMFPGWSEFKVERIQTQLGPISYSIKRSLSKMDIAIEKPVGKIRFYFDSLKVEGYEVKCNGRMIKAGDWKRNANYQYGIDLPETACIVSLNYG
jgi:hypothetical protein